MVIPDGFLIGLAIFGFIGFATALVFFGHLSQKRRTAAFQEQADQMGLSFVPNPDNSQPLKQFGFKLFSRGRNHRVTNLVEGDSGDVKISIFDYRYVIGGGRSTTTHRQTIIALQSTQLRCPEFTMRPKVFVDKIGSVIGFQDLNFESHPEFSKLFVLQGPDEAAIRDFLTPTAMEFFERHPKDSLEACSGAMFFYRVRAIRKPDELNELLTQAYEAFGVLTETNA